MWSSWLPLAAFGYRPQGLQTSRPPGHQALKIHSFLLSCHILEFDLELLAAPGCFWRQASRLLGLHAFRPPGFKIHSFLLSCLFLQFNLELLAAPGCFWLQASRPPGHQAFKIHSFLLSCLFSEFNLELLAGPWLLLAAGLQAFRPPSHQAFKIH